MLILQQEEDPGPFRSRWQPTWVEVMQRNDTEECPERSSVLRRLALTDSEEEEDSDKEAENRTASEEVDMDDTRNMEWENHIQDGSERLPTCFPSTFCHFGRSASANWHRPRTHVPLRSKTTSSLCTTSKSIETKELSDSCNSLPSPCDLLLATNHLKNEATLALAQAEPMARMQLEVERQLSPFEPAIINISSDHKATDICNSLHQMDKSQLHTVIDRLLDQISGTNKELVELLIERDNLHMAQDAMLIDVEDETRRAHDLVNLMQTNGSSDRRRFSTKCSQTSDRAHGLFSRVFSWTKNRTNTVKS